MEKWQKVLRCWLRNDEAASLAEATVPLGHGLTASGIVSILAFVEIHQLFSRNIFATSTRSCSPLPGGVQGRGIVLSVVKPIFDVL